MKSRDFYHRGTLYQANKLDSFTRSGVTDLLFVDWIDRRFPPSARLPAIMSNSPNHSNDASQTLLIFLATFGFSAVMYFSGGNHIIDAASTKRTILRELYNKGQTVHGKSESRPRGRKYFDNKRLRELQDYDEYIQLEVAGEPIEFRADLWGSPPSGEFAVRYLASKPETSYYTHKPDLLQAISSEIRGYTIQLAFVWAVVLLPAAFGVLVLLVSINPMNGRLNLIWLVLTAAAFLATYLYFVW